MLRAFYPAFSNISILYGASPRRISYRLFQWDSSWFHSFPRPGKVDVLSCDVEAMIGNYCAPNWGFHCNFAPSQFSASSILSLKGTHYTKNSYVMIGNLEANLEK